MLGYPIVDRSLRELTRGELGANPLCHEVARKAQARGAVSKDVALLTGTIWGTFSHRNDPDGYVVSYTASPRGFPDGTDSMSRYADMTAINEARLIANIVNGGTPGPILSVNGAGEVISIGLEVIDTSPEIIIGTWHPVTASGATLLEWKIEGSGSGTVTVGLIQLQVK